MINRFLDWMVLSLESLERGRAGKSCLWIAAAGILATGAIWLFHLNHPLFSLTSYGLLRTIIIVIVLAPPFFTVVSIAYYFFPKTSLPPESTPGLMSTFQQREKNDKRWKIMIAAGIVSAANLLLMILNSSVQ